MIPIRIDGPAVEPVSAVEMRAYLRLDGDGEDALVADLVRSARLAIEEATRRVLVESRWRIALSGWPVGSVAVPLVPLCSIGAASLVASDGGTLAVSAGLVRVDAAQDPPRLVLGPRPAEAEGKTLVVEVIAGDPVEAVPASLVQAMRLLVAHWFENRGDAAEAAPALPGPVLALLAPHRRPRL